MKPSLKKVLFPSPITAALLLGTFALAGCGGAMTTGSSSSVSAPATTEQVAGPAVQGYVYGGHAPIQGAHVYLLQPGTTGYGSPANSILGTGSTTSPGGYTLTANSSDPNVPSGAEYVTSDSTGSFNLTGAYVCTVGRPVYIYAWGGNIGTTSGTAAISQIVISNAANGHSGTATYAVTVSSSAVFTVGESVTVAGLGGDFTILNGTQTLTAGGTGTFTFTAADNYGPYGYSTLKDGSYSTTNFGTGGTATYSVAPTTNPNIVQLATLGNCPSSGNFSTGSSALSYIYLNEVSTVATAYTFQPFTLVGNNNAWDIGTPNHTQALLGIANAASTAAQLYNIQGGGPQSTANDGEGHLANYQTQLNGVSNSGNGVVPEATIDSLANILASCVDSVPPSPGTPSTQCSALFSIATDDGTTSGTQPTDTATAAVDIARFPAGNHSSANVSSSYAADIFALQSGTVPYVPDLINAPNDWTIAINYPYAAVGGYTSAVNTELYRAESIAVDSNGQIWLTAQGGGNGATSPAPSINLWSPLGAPLSSYSNTPSYIYGYVSVDGSNNAWTGNASSNGNNGNPAGTSIEEFNDAGSLIASYGSGYGTAYTVIANQADDAYFFANYLGAASPSYDTYGNYEMWEYNSAGTLLSSNIYCDSTPGAYVYDCISPPIFGSGDNVAHGAIDASGDLWLTSEGSPYQIARVSSTGAEVWRYTSDLKQPEFPAIDANGDGWIANQANTAVIYKFAPGGGTPTTLTGGSSGTGAELTWTFGSAVDGNGNVWFANRCGNYGGCGSTTAGINSIVEINGTGTTTPGTVDTAISPPTNYIPEAQYPATATGFTTMLQDSLNLAIDPSGNVWITNYIGNAVVELVGAAAPVATPLSVAAGGNELGQKP